MKKLKRKKFIDHSTIDFCDSDFYDIRSAIATTLDIASPSPFKVNLKKLDRKLKNYLEFWDREDKK